MSITLKILILIVSLLIATVIHYVLESLCVKYFPYTPAGYNWGPECSLDRNSWVTFIPFILVLTLLTAFLLTKLIKRLISK